ncbi:hypothetical protein GYMLUDRAFT_33319 [Collybiopsis luxurians FD-317 M1]|nr:hypothetical protein GYMLUDRAFT_33319 [Collybiopsis luxurians FD-317 M1]
MDDMSMITPTQALLGASFALGQYQLVQKNLAILEDHNTGCSTDPLYDLRRSRLDSRLVDPRKRTTQSREKYEKQAKLIEIFNAKETEKKIALVKSRIHELDSKIIPVLRRRLSHLPLSSSEAAVKDLAISVQGMNLEKTSIPARPSDSERSGSLVSSDEDSEVNQKMRIIRSELEQVAREVGVQDFESMTDERIQLAAIGFGNNSGSSMILAEEDFAIVDDSMDSDRNSVVPNQVAFGLQLGLSHLQTVRLQVQKLGEDNVEMENMLVKLRKQVHKQKTACASGKKKIQALRQLSLRQKEWRELAWMVTNRIIEREIAPVVTKMEEAIGKQIWKMADEAGKHFERAWSMKDDRVLHTLTEEETANAATEPSTGISGFSLNKRTWSQNQNWSRGTSSKRLRRD